METKTPDVKVEKENETPSAPSAPPAPELASPVVTIDAKTLTAPLGSTMPDPTPGTRKSAAIDAKTDVTDAAGVVFDPEKHAADDAGRPKKNKHGRFYPAKLGRPRKSLDFGDSVAPDSPDESSDETARAIVNLAGVPLVAWLGPDAAFEPQEVDALTPPTAAVLRRYNVTELHPGVVLAAVAIGIITAKMRKPTVRERFDAFWKKITGKA